jgi:hypothetical protein
MGYPGSVQTFTTKQDGVDYPQVSHINPLQTEITAIETELVTSGLTNKLTVNAGIGFPATQAASTDANTLDDYEEGTFTPAVSFGGGTTGITYSTSTARYLKVGKNVWINGIVTLTNKGSSTGAARLTGLPFAEGDTAATLLQVMQITGFSSVSVALGGIITASGSVATLVQQGAAGYSTMDDTNFSNTSAFYFSGWYRAAA